MYATRKKNGRVYYYYQCNVCKITIKETKIIEGLQYRLENANDTIDELEDKVSELQNIVYYFKDLWKKFIEFLKDKFFSNDKYDDFINDLYNEDILNGNDTDMIKNNKIKIKVMILKDKYNNMKKK